MITIITALIFSLFVYGLVVVLMNIINGIMKNQTIPAIIFAILSGLISGSVLSAIYFAKLIL